MAKETLLIGIEEDGSLTIDFEGYVGQTCTQAGQELQAALSALGVKWEQSPGVTPKGQGRSHLNHQSTQRTRATLPSTQRKEL